MNNNFFEQLKKIRETIALSAQEKDAARDSIKRFVETYVPTGSVPSPFMQTTRYFLQPLQVAALSFVILLMSGAGLTYAAQDALPGEALYGIKVNINEGVRAWSINDPRSRAEYEIGRAAKRLEETAQLALMGRLDARAEVEIREQLEKHTDRAQREAAKMTGADAVENLEVTTKLASELSARSSILEDIKTAKNTNGELTAILAAAQETLDELAETQLATSTEIRANNTEAAEIRAHTKFEEVTGQLALLDEKLATASATIANDLDSMGQELERFNTELETESKSDTETSAILAVRSAVEPSEEEPEVVEALSEETSTSVVVTEAKIDSRRARISSTKELGTVALVAAPVTEPTLTKKIIDQKAIIENLLSEAQKSIDNGNFGDALVTLQEADKKAKEILTEIDLQASYQKNLDPILQEKESEEAPTERGTDDVVADTNELSETVKEILPTLPEAAD